MKKMFLHEKDGFFCMVKVDFVFLYKKMVFKAK